MIRKLYFFILIGVVFFACKDDDMSGFDAMTEFRNIEFEPMPGGAIMRYYLPENEDIYGIRVRYTNAWDEQQVRESSYLSDSLMLTGFTEARTDVPALVSFFNRQMQESEPMEITFSTEKSATVAIFDSLTVNPFWGGFNVTYRTPETVNGIIHVFYLGINPYTQAMDSILMASLPITEGGDTLNFVMTTPQESIDVIVRTDSYDGKRVKQEIIPGVPCLIMDTLTPADFDFRFTGEIVKSDEYEVGEQYLLDGDKKGFGFRENRLGGERYKYSTFVAGPYAFGERFIVDLREAKVPAAVNLYAYMYFGDNYPIGEGSDPFALETWTGCYPTRLPCKITLYGTNENPETVDLSTCAKLFQLDDPVSNSYWDEYSWARYTDCYGSGSYELFPTYGTSWLDKTVEEMEAAEPVVLNMLCNYTGAEYRYLIFVVADTYSSGRWGNDEYEDNVKEYVSFNELEVCVNAE